ncbi:glycosyltransferase [Acetoanaerobium pronyense]|uniref:glycosyltransferase n=1 Tax=Acetoanaerobium pronyense TaxID=1482736 RepID=UPI001FD93A72|nr:glycosyltransferase [Acetoanaerobium pronyense]
MIEENKTFEARLLINEHFKIEEIDIEIFSMLGIIEILEGNFSSAKRIFKEGLDKEPQNYDLLYNIHYLFNNFLAHTSEKNRYYIWSKLFDVNLEVENPFIIQERQAFDIKKSNVLHGTIEIANQMNTVTRGLSNMGINAKSLNYYPSYLKYKTDYEIDLYKGNDPKVANVISKKLASRFINENDIFHFHFGTSLTLDYSDLPLLKELQKKVVMQYWGSDIRLYSKAVKMNPYIKVKDMNEDRIKRKLELVSKYIPDCIVDYELAEYAKEFHENIHYTKVAINLDEYNYSYCNESSERKITIVHAPTSPEHKGTDFILRAISELSINFDIDFELVEGKSNEEAKKIYMKADLVIDQILAGSYGVFAVEAMAMGKPVICWISDFMKEQYPEDLPIISANPDTIKNTLEKLLKNRDSLKEIGNDGRKYVEKYHDVNCISKNMIEIYNKI